jgi:hypothetical protein
LEEVEDLINAAELENAITAEKQKFATIVGNSNEPTKASER